MPEVRGYIVRRELDRKSVNMDKEQINELFMRFEEACYIHGELQCWSARAGKKAKQREE